MKYADKTETFVRRTSSFGENIIELCRRIKTDSISRLIVIQLVRSGTSIGANYCEAINASSKKDFKHKIFICKKETQETKYWLQMLAKNNPETKGKTREYWKECQEFIMIFQAIINSMNRSKKRN
jgi:four helix bundle protein